MIFELVKDYADALAAMPEVHPRQRILRLLQEGILRNVHFVDRHPTTMFQCMWNTCWWYDREEAAAHYREPEGGWTPKNAPWLRPEEPKLYAVLEHWRQSRQQSAGRSAWIRSHLAPWVGLGAGQKFVFRGHSPSYSPDGRTIAVGGDDCTVRLWDAESGEEVRALRGHQNRVNIVSYSPDGRRIVSGSGLSPGVSGDFTLRVWDVESGVELWQTRLEKFSYSPDSRRIVTGHWPNTVRIRDAESGDEIAVLEGKPGCEVHEDALKRKQIGRITSVASSPDGQRIASGGDDGTVRIWDAQGGVELSILHAYKDFEEYTRRYYCDFTGGIAGVQVSFSPDSRRIVSVITRVGSPHTNVVRVWDAESGSPLTLLCGHEDRVTTVSYSLDGWRIVSGSRDGTVRVWDAESGAELQVLRGHQGSVQCLAHRPDGRRIISGSQDGTVRVWDAESGTELQVLRGHDGTVECIAYSPDGRRIVSSGDGTVRVWDAESSSELVSLLGCKYRVPSDAGLLFSADGRQIVSRGGDHRWDAETAAELPATGGDPRRVRIWAFSPDGRQVVCSFADKMVRVCDARSGDEVAVLRGGGKPALCSLSYSPNGRRIATGSDRDEVSVWNAKSGRQLAVLRGHENSVISVSYSPDGRRIASGSRDGTVRVWDAMSTAWARLRAAIAGRQPTVLRGQRLIEFRSVSYSPDGQRIAGGAGDGKVWVWDAQTGAELAVLCEHELCVHDVRYSPDGRRIVSASLDATTRVWDARTFQCIEVIPGWGGDVAAIAAGASAGFPWRAICRDGETVIEPMNGGGTVARFPKQLGLIATQPSGRTWAGLYRHHLYIISLEDEPGAFSSFS